MLPVRRPPSMTRVTDTRVLDRHDLECTTLRKDAELNPEERSSAGCWQDNIVTHLLHVFPPALTMTTPLCNRKASYGKSGRKAPSNEQLRNPLGLVHWHSNERPQRLAVRKTLLISRFGAPVVWQGSLLSHT